MKSSPGIRNCGISAPPCTREGNRWGVPWPNHWGLPGTSGNRWEHFYNSFIHIVFYLPFLFPSLERSTGTYGNRIRRHAHTPPQVSVTLEGRYLPGARGSQYPHEESQEVPWKYHVGDFAKGKPGAESNHPLAPRPARVSALRACQQLVAIQHIKRDRPCREGSAPPAGVAVCA